MTPYYAKLPSGAVVRVDDVTLARRMRPEELPEESVSGFLIFGAASGSTRSFTVHPQDVEALATFFDSIAGLDLTPEGPVKR